MSQARSMAHGLEYRQGTPFPLTKLMNRYEEEGRGGASLVKKCPVRCVDDMRIAYFRS